MNRQPVRLYRRRAASAYESLALLPARSYSQLAGHQSSSAVNIKFFIYTFGPTDQLCLGCPSTEFALMGFVSDTIHAEARPSCVV